MELLLTFVIMALLTPVVFNVFQTGQKTYIKQNAEVQFREDADYAVTMVMNEFYRTAFDYVDNSCGDNCIRIVDSKALDVEKQASSAYYKIEEQEQAEKKTISIALDNGVLEIDGAPLEISSDLTGSSISYKCGAEEKDQGCRSGIIQLKLRLSDEKTNQNLILESEFGF